MICMQCIFSVPGIKSNGITSIKFIVFNYNVEILMVSKSKRKLRETL